jgi:hypothetical protein
MRAALLLLVLAATSTNAATPAPGRYAATFCVATAASAPANCGAAELRVISATRGQVRIADIVYLLHWRPALVDVATMQGKMEIDEFSAAYEWRDGSLSFVDPDKGVRYEVRIGKRR